jgi:Putative GTPase activating protein for Arf
MKSLLFDTLQTNGDLHSCTYRGLGVHISFVRSVRMDSWSTDQIRLMKLGGNDRCNAFFVQHGMEKDMIHAADDDSSDRSRIIRQKYDSPPAMLYKQVLKAERDGLPIPTELPVMTAATPSLNSLDKKKMQGFGSSPMPQSPATRFNDPNVLTKRILYIAVPAVVGAAIWMLSPH